MTCLNCKHNKILRRKCGGNDYHLCLEQENRNSLDYAKECEFYVPKTNAEKIRSMNDEELAEFLEGDYGNFETGKAILWLKQTVEGE